jgi:hypothetical protein
MRMAFAVASRSGIVRNIRCHAAPMFGVTTRAGTFHRGMASKRCCANATPSNVHAVAAAICAAVSRW